MFATRLHSLAGGIEVPAGCQPKFSRQFTEWMLVTKVISSVNKFNGRYKQYVDRLTILPTKDWVKFDYEKVMSHMRQVHDNVLSINSAKDSVVSMHVTGGDGGGRSRQRDKSREPRSGQPAAQGSEKGGENKRERSRTRGRSASAAPHGHPSNCPPGACWDYWQGKPCKAETAGKTCKFEHVKKSSMKPSEAKQEPKKKGCGRCGDQNHRAHECKYDATCGECGRKGHKTSMCRSRARSVSRAP